MITLFSKKRKHAMFHVKHDLIRVLMPLFVSNVAKQYHRGCSLYVRKMRVCRLRLWFLQRYSPSRESKCLSRRLFLGATKTPLLRFQEYVYSFSGFFAEIKHLRGANSKKLAILRHGSPSTRQTTSDSDDLQEKCTLDLSVSRETFCISCAKPSCRPLAHENSEERRRVKGQKGGERRKRRGKGKRRSKGRRATYRAKTMCRSLSRDQNRAQSIYKLLKLNKGHTQGYIRNTRILRKPCAKCT